MELRHLKSFLAVAEVLNFTRASQRLHLSQPALTAHIQQLESDLGTPLFTRTRRAVTLTPAGISFQRDAAAILQSLLDAERRALQSASGEAGHLRIGFVASAALNLVPPIVIAFRQRYPLITLDLTNLRSIDQIVQLEDGSIDAGFIRLPLTHRSLDIVPIHKEPFVLVLPANHPLAARPDLRPEDTASENFLAYGRRFAPGFFDRWTAIFERAGFTPRIVQETGEMGTLLALVAAGLGIAVVPSGIARNSGAAIAIRPLPARSPLSEIGLATRSGNTNPILEKLRKVSRGMGKTASSTYHKS